MKRIQNKKEKKWKGNKLEKNINLRKECNQIRKKEE